MRKTAVLLAAAVLAAFPLAAVPITARQTATVTRASTPTGCPATVTAEADVKLVLKVVDDRSLAMRIRWSDAPSASVAVPPADVVLLGRSSTSATFHVRQTHAFSASTSGWFSLNVHSAYESGETEHKAFTVTCGPTITVVPGAFPRQSPVPFPAR